MIPNVHEDLDLGEEVPEVGNVSIGTNRLDGNRESLRVSCEVTLDDHPKCPCPQHLIILCREEETENVNDPEIRKIAREINSEQLPIE